MAKNPVALMGTRLQNSRVATVAEVVVLIEKEFDTHGSSEVEGDDLKCLECFSFLFFDDKNTCSALTGNHFLEHAWNLRAGHSFGQQKFYTYLDL